MKTILVFFRTADNPFDGKYYADVVELFRNGGINVDAVDVLSQTDDIGFKRRLFEYKDTADNLVVVDDVNLLFDLKEMKLS